jgi:hypothetical protein
VRIEACSGSAAQQWRVGSAGQLISHVTGACVDGARGTAGQDAYTNFCVRNAADPAPIGQTWKVSALDTAGELRLVASGTRIALGEPDSGAHMSACGQAGITQHAWRLPSPSQSLYSVSLRKCVCTDEYLIR